MNNEVLTNTIKMKQSMSKKILLLFTVALFTLNISGQTNTFPSSGNVGIGTTNPDGLLEIYSPVRKRSVIFNEAGSIKFKYSELASGGWAMGSYFIGYDGTLFDGWRALGSGSTLKYLYAGGSYSAPHFVIKPDGKVGIGTTSPDHKLEVFDSGNLYDEIIKASTDVSGVDSYTALAASKLIYRRETSTAVPFIIETKVQASSTTGGDIVFSPNGPSNYIPVERMRIQKNGNVGIGTSTPSEKLEINGNAKVNGSGTTIGLSTISNAWLKIGSTLGMDNNEIMFETTSYIGTVSNHDLRFVTNGQKNMVIDANGNVGIGILAPTYKLAVEGTIGAREVVVTNDAWADFVFEENYNLMPLQELDTYIQENKHLPEIPTTEEVKENGISVGEMNAKLLQKIEELTLYTLQQQEVIEALKTENNEHKQNYAELKNEIEEIKKLIK